MNTLKINETLFTELLTEARNSPRKRSHRNIHNDLNEAVQRLCIGLKKGTYIRPHYHPQPHKWEMMLVLKGSVSYIIFDQAGTVQEKLTIGTGESTCGIEIQPNTWHTLFPLSDETIILEVKQGPYEASQPTDFAPWAPEEGDAEAQDFLAWLDRAGQGEQYPV